MEDLTFRANHVIKNEIEIVQNQMTRNNVDLIFGTARFVDPHRLRIATGSGTSSNIRRTSSSSPVGTDPARPADIPFDDHTIIDTDGLLTLKHLPTSIMIIGGGVIGTEYASILATMGIQVTLIESGRACWSLSIRRSSRPCRRHMTDIGVTLCHEEEVVAIRKEAGRTGHRPLTTDKPITTTTLMYAIGRIGATKRLNLEIVGITPDARGRVTVNEHFQTAVPHIYAAGDIIGFPALASTSMQQGRHAACHAFGYPDQTDTDLLPYGIYSIPEISMVGRNEEDLAKAGIPYAVGIARYREIARGQIIGDETGMLKLLFHRQTRRSSASMPSAKAPRS